MVRSLCSLQPASLFPSLADLIHTLQGDENRVSVQLRHLSRLDTAALCRDKRRERERESDSQRGGKKRYSYFGFSLRMG